MLVFGVFLPNVLLGQKAYFQVAMVVGRRFSGVSTQCEKLRVSKPIGLSFF